jgi:2-alkenal reductase
MQEEPQMNTKQRPKWMIAVVVMVLALTTMACGFTIQPPDFGQVSPPWSAPQERQPALPRPTAGLPAIAQGEEAERADERPAIPRTGPAEMGSLADPVTQAPGDLETLYDQSNPGVVSILTQVNQGGQVGGGAGSGFILTDNGYIVTNHHVIEGATTIIVRFYNNADIEAELIGDDPNSDLAILKVERMADGAAPLPLGDSDAVRVGDAVVAIGNPFSLGTSMSYGIISAVGRTIPSGFTPYNIPQAIQTDAAINPGNSGGPLINMNGEVIGINAQIRTAGGGGGNVGIGFAIPVNILKLIYPSLIDQGSYRWPYLGVSSPAETVLSLDARDLAEQRGALIASVERGGPAAAAGLREGDIVTAADGQPVTNFDDLFTYVSFQAPGADVRLTVVRGGQEQEVVVTLGDRPGGGGLFPGQ